MDERSPLAGAELSKSAKSRASASSGVHVIGEQATEIVHIGMIALLTGSTAALFAEACFNLPTLGELYKLASLDAMTQVATGHSLLQ